MAHRPFEPEYLLYSSTKADLAAHAPSQPRVDGHPGPTLSHVSSSPLDNTLGGVGPVIFSK
jgi:hypothetical protein